MLVSSEQDEIQNSKITMPNHKEGGGGGNITLPNQGIQDFGMCLLQDKHLITIHVGQTTVDNPSKNCNYGDLITLITLKR